MDQRGQGILAMLAVCLIWGISGLYYKPLAPFGAGTVLAHRTFWSFVLFGGILAVQGRLPALWAILTGPQLGRVALAAVMISINWLGFIWAVQNGHAVEASLGYFIFPLASVLAGVVFFNERLSPAKWLAVALAGVAVLVLIYGLSIGPWISLLLAFSFCAYGVIKKGLDLGPMISVAAEVALLTPLALLWLLAVAAGWIGAADAPGIFASGGLAVMLVLSGAMTAVPLMLFAFAARRVDLATIGLLQYLNPTLQFLVAVLVMGEAVTRWHLIAFALIWTALAIYTRASWQARRLVPDATLRIREQTK
ncbi:MAG: EamA family transporter RarD [Paracoccus sp. (in: a-proteobacteria)]|uniref:EamA family transporter RarD n=1 Tax=Paracoccus sp. TaxID=267 RepID=UPI0026DFE5A2|nr:EamA family transporter RarD [Paracoccus sp. (in: a-proteobacteria)]MDO5620473.1 EamA family transporter RarD [Paracoccus sp. (in: a-proteobacteria)]